MALLRRTSATSEVAGLLHLLGQLLRRDAVALGLGDDVLGEVLVGDPDLLGIGERVEHELGLDRLLGAAAHLGVDVGLALLLRLQVVLPAHAGLGQLPVDVLLPPVELGLHDGVRQRYVGRGE